MANPNGQWFTTNLQVPEPIQDLAQALDSILDALLTILNITVAILEIVKTFLIGLLDPIAAIIDAIISEIEGLIQDIRQIGVYVSGDFESEYPYDNLIGGFDAYERRMIARLVDRLDPTRPNFTSRSQVVAIFLYVSVDVTAIQSAVALIDRIKAFFGVRTKFKTYTQPVGLEVVYGAAGAGLANFGTAIEVFNGGGLPTVASVRWSMAPPTNSGVVSWPLPAPAGFLIEVSVVRDGLVLSWEAPVDQASPDEQGQQNRQYGLVSDPEGKPFRLYGGIDMLDVTDLEWSASGSTYDSGAVSFAGDLKPGAMRLLAYRDSADNVPIPLNALKTSDGKYLLQRTFFLDVQGFLGVNAIGPGQPFKFKLNYDDMPYDATFEDAGNGKVSVSPADEPARSVFVRVSAVTTSFTGTTAPTDKYWQLGSSLVESGQRAGVVRLEYNAPLTGADKSLPSSPLAVTFPGSSTQAYLDAVTAALIVMVLSRSDLVPNDGTGGFQVDVGGQATGLEEIARYLMGQTVGRNDVEKYFARPNVSPIDFRGRLLTKCRAMACILLDRTGPLPTAVEELVVERSLVGETPLAEVSWSTLAPDFGLDATLIEALDPSTDAGQDLSLGLALNPLSTGTLTVTVTRHLLQAEVIPLERTPGFLVKPGTSGAFATGSSDNSPVIFNGRSSMAFCRNVFLANEDVLTAARLVLNVAAAPMAYSRRPGEGAWVAMRLFPQGLPPIEAMLNEIIGFLNALKEGIKAITDLIVQYIEFVQARILELEALIRRIQALLDAMLLIEVPVASTLLVTADGTDGILQGLVTATGKPSDASTSYGMGAVILAGGLPTAVAELFGLLLADSGE